MSGHPRWTRVQLKVLRERRFQRKPVQHFNSCASRPLVRTIQIHLRRFRQLEEPRPAIFASATGGIRPLSTPLTSREWYMSQLFRVRVTPFASTGFGDGAPLVFWNKPTVAASVANFRQRQQ